MQGRKLLRETYEGMLENCQLRQSFANLCEYDVEKSAFNFDGTTISFQFLKVFGQFRANEVALKYNSNVFKGNNQVNFRASIGAQNDHK